LKPIKRKQLVEKTAAQLGINEELVDEIVVNYWDYVRKQMSQVVHTHIYVPNFGTFFVKPKALTAKIISIRKYMDKLSHPKTLDSYARRRDRVVTVEHLENIQEQINQLYQKKHEKRIQRYQVLQSNIKLETDTRRFPELDLQG